MILPTTPLVWGWHLDCIIAHIEAVQRHEIATLVVNVPPRHAKSNIISVLAPGWLWANDPGVKLLTGSYAMPLATRDATRTRRLITSAKHTAMFPALALEKDQNEKTRYDLVGGGARYCFATGGGVTGEGGDIAIWDDPHKAADMYSQAAMDQAARFWSETLPTRLNDPLKSSKIVVMQRLGPTDMTGHILAEASEGDGGDVVHVVLPMRYDPKRHMQTAWFEDPRTEPGQLLWPERMSERAIRRVTKDMSPQAVAAQMDQAPVSQSGAIFPRERWRIWTEWRLPTCHTIMISHDPAVKEREENDIWACHIWGVFDDDEDGKPAFMLLGAWGEHMTYPVAKRKLMQTVEDWTIEGEPPDYVAIEDKAAGPMLLNELGLAGIKNLVAYNPGKRSKMERAQVQSDLHYTGRIWVPGKKLGDQTRSDMVLPSWAERVVAAMALFGAPGAPDDDVDAAVQAWHLLRDLRLVSLDTDQDDEDDGMVEHHPVPREPAYA